MVERTWEFCDVESRETVVNLAEFNPPGEVAAGVAGSSELVAADVVDDTIAGSVVTSGRASDASGIQAEFSSNAIAKKHMIPKSPCLKAPLATKKSTGDTSEVHPLTLLFWLFTSAEGGF